MVGDSLENEKQEWKFGTDISRTNGEKCSSAAAECAIHHLCLTCRSSTSTTDGIAFSLNSKFTKTARDKGQHRRRSMKRQAEPTRSTPAIQRALPCAP